MSQHQPRRLDRSLRGVAVLGVLAMIVTTLVVVGLSSAGVRADQNEGNPATRPYEAVISAGGNFTCALFSSGNVKCWGYNGSGQLGLGDTFDRGDGPGEMGDQLPFVALGAGRTATAISAGTSSVCALLDNGTVKCWGDNFGGQLGLGDTNRRGDGPGEMGDNLPAVNLGTGRTATAISAREAHACALLDNGSIKCWGFNNRGQLGLGDMLWRGDNPGEMGDNLPTVDLGPGQTATAVAVGYVSTCALLERRRGQVLG